MAQDGDGDGGLSGGTYALSVQEQQLDKVSTAEIRPLRGYVT